MASCLIQLTLYKRNGMGMNAIERNPKVELAHATPRFLYIAVAKRGNPAPKDDRIRSASEKP